MILGQNELAAATNTEIHTLTEERVIEQIIFCNSVGTPANMRLWLLQIGASIDSTNRVMFDRVLPANSTLLVLEHDFTMRTGESIHAYASASGVSVTVLGRPR